VSDFPKAAVLAFQPLIASGQLALESAATDRAAFGNSIVLLRGKAIRVRLVRDRGQVFVEIACMHTPDQWDLLQQALTAIDEQAPPDGPLSLECGAELLKRSIVRLERHLCDESTSAKLAQMRAEAARRFLRPL